MTTRVEQLVAQAKLNRAGATVAVTFTCDDTAARAVMEGLTRVGRVQGMPAPPALVVAAARRRARPVVAAAAAGVCVCVCVCLCVCTSNVKPGRRLRPFLMQDENENESARQVGLFDARLRSRCNRALCKPENESVVTQAFHSSPPASCAYCAHKWQVRGERSGPPNSRGHFVRHESSRKREFVFEFVRARLAASKPHDESESCVFVLVFVLRKERPHSSTRETPVKASSGAWGSKHFALPWRLLDAKRETFSFVGCAADEKQAPFCF